MAIKYLDSKRLVGVAGDLTATPVIGVGGWKEVGRTTLGSSGDLISVASLPDKRYYMILGYYLPDGNFNGKYRVNNDSSGNYARRNRGTGNSSDSTALSQTEFQTDTIAGNGFAQFDVGYISNLTSKEKLIIMHTIKHDGTGASTNIKRIESVGKWANTSSAINRIDCVNAAAGSFASGSECVILGWDESDTHTSNFWEHLGTTELTTAGDNIEVTFTAKKYLMVKFYRKQTGAADARWTFNNDGGTSYASITSANGGTDSPSVSQNYFTQYTYDNSNPSYSSTMIINTAGQEKLGTQHEMTPNSAGAGNATHRSESVFKWTNTSDQITTIDITNSKSGSYDVGSRIEVWGHD